MLTPVEAAKLLFEEFKYLHNQFWEAFYKFGLIIVTVNIIPYIKPDIIKVLQSKIVIFPVTGLLITLVASWILVARYQRISKVKIKI
jgi:uncharacterized membrane protein AbrB (regulator of aidB expression)